MITYHRIALEDTIIAMGLMTAGWYLYYLVGGWSMLDYLQEGTMRDYITSPAIHVEILISGAGFGLIMGLVNQAMEGKRARQMSFGRVIVLKSLIYLAGLAVLGVLVNLIFSLFLFSPEEMEEMWALLTPRFLVGVWLWLAVSIVGTNFLLEVRRKVGPGNLWALLTGRYHTPREEDRVFLFVDLENSTGIAEELGHSRYSQFLRQCFHDLSDFVLQYGGQIYQFVGDEVVLTWPSQTPEASRKALDTFFAFRERLSEKAEWYQKTYGATPTFKCGMERGRVTATEVGDIKREIAFHGDPLNTAARLMVLCKEYKQAILISGGVRETLSGDPGWITHLKGEVTLRGKVSPVSVFGVEPVALTP